tara:strand:- start:3219 stop:4226 length:1008 start_codon:yes stop_codon:yes gene_type:complete
MPRSSHITLAAITAGLLLTATPATAQVSPDIMNLLIIASQKDNGAHLDMVMDMAIAAKPDAEQDIRALVANLRQKMPTVEETPVVAEQAIEGKTIVVKEHTPEQADSAPAPEAVTTTPGFFSLAGWDGEVELNILHSTGNTRQQSFGLGGKLERESGKFHHTISSYFNLNKNSGVKDKQNWGTSYKLDYSFGEKVYVTSFAGYENDQFGAFRERITTSLGLGYPFIEKDDYSWKLEGGPSILFTKEENGDSYDSSFNGFASSIFKWTINERSNLNNTTSFYFGNKTVIESKSALKVKINGALSSKFSYEIRYDQDAPVDREKTDTVARVGLLYDF